MEHYIRRNNCRLCESTNCETIMRFVATPPGDEYVSKEQLSIQQPEFPLELDYCLSCGFVQIPNIVEPEYLYKNYTYETNISLNLSNHFASYALYTLDYLKLPKGSRVFEIGCNDGTLLENFHKAGMNVVGIEPATSIAKKAERKGLTIVNDFFSETLAQDLKSKFGSAALICANNVLANIDNVRDFFQGIHYLLSSEGVFVFETGYMVDLFENDVIDNVHHEHVSYFSLYPLVKYLKEINLKLLHVLHVETKGGSMRFFISKESSSHKIAPSVSEYLNKELNLGFDKVETVRKMAKKHEAERDKLIKLLKKLKDNGKRIAAYGASVGGTTLLYYYQIGEYLEFIVDDNPIKQGMFSPGLKLPVHHPKYLNEKNIDYVVNFAWRYLGPIKEKNQDFIKRGGKFIQTLPEVKVDL